MIRQSAFTLAGAPLTCIFCGAAATSARRAHVVPEGVVANDLVLDSGIECDGCNEHFADIENAFIHHNRIWTAIMLGRVPGKGGRPRRNLGHLAVDRDEQTVRIRLRVPERHVQRTPDGGITIQMPDPPAFDDLKFRRALHCIGLRYVAFKGGPDLARDERFDRVRKYVRAPQRGESWPYVQYSFADDVIRKQLGLGRVPMAPGNTVRLRLFHDDFFCDLENTGKLHEWARSTLGDKVGLL